MNGPIRAVIWDVGGVIVRTEDHSGRSRWEQQLGLPQGELENMVFRGEMGVRAALGQATPRQAWEWVGDRLGITSDELPLLEHDFWSGDRLDQHLMDFIRGLRPQYKLGLLSNAWSRMRSLLKEMWRIEDAFDHITISAEVGLLKPDPRIYHHSLAGLQVTAKEAVFVDDFEENVVGARAVGIHGLRFTDRAQVIAHLQELQSLGG